jgi:hypothetical protein
MLSILSKKLQKILIEIFVGFSTSFFFCLTFDWNSLQRMRKRNQSSSSKSQEMEF